ncbi:MAG: glycosyltransferase family 1 protein [Gammaproteobacteria bacterium]|nr:MAG: glycosyltransferase family 1 protein [Gammaproteobacteria bacterium]
MSEPGALRITLVSADFAPNVGGVAAHVVELGKALAGLAQDVDVVTLPLGEARDYESHWQGMRVWRPRLPKAEPFYSWLLHRWLRGYLRHCPRDILHVHGMRPLGASRGLGLPVVFTNHTSGYLKRIEKGGREIAKIRRRLAHIDQVLAPSEELCEATRAGGYGGMVEFIPNGVDTAVFQPGESPLRRDWDLAADETVILLARRLVEKNGVIVLARAMAHLADLPVRLVVAGDGPERGAMERILGEAGMLDRTLFLGSVANARMPDVYRAADISVLPSFMEATSITGLESMACGLPLVGTRVGGIPALIAEGETGLLVPPGDPEALAQALRELVVDPERRQTMGQWARERAETEFSWRQIAGRTLGVYRRLPGAGT